MTHQRVVRYSVMLMMEEAMKREGRASLASLAGPGWARRSNCHTMAWILIYCILRFDIQLQLIFHSDFVPLFYGINVGRRRNWWWEWEEEVTDAGCQLFIMAGQRENASGPIFRSDDIYPNQDHDDDVRKRNRRRIEGGEKGKNLCFQQNELISLCQDHTLIVTSQNFCTQNHDWTNNNHDTYCLSCIDKYTLR